MSLVSTDEMPDVHRVTNPKARKPYCCGECAGHIAVGDVYRRDFTVFYGEAETHICCDDCDKLMAKFFAAIPKDYRHEITFATGELKSAVVELRSEFGVTIEGFKYPPAEILHFHTKETSE
tara:strand:- start:510 stop:872 length:363 start_codon:yes stop_codon:yes gene_type:complete